MNLLMMSIRDSVSGTYGRPFFEISEDTARRSVGMEVNNAQANNVLFTNPGDFELFALGTFDDVSGAVHMLDAPRAIVNLRGLVREAAPA